MTVDELIYLIIGAIIGFGIALCAICTMKHLDK